MHYFEAKEVIHEKYAVQGKPDCMFKARVEVCRYNILVQSRNSKFFNHAVLCGLLMQHTFGLKNMQIPFLTPIFN